MSVGVVGRPFRTPLLGLSESYRLPETTGGPHRSLGWWLPPGRYDSDDTHGSDSYMHRIRLETGQHYKYEVIVEGRDVVIRGEVHENTTTRRYEHKFVKRHRLPDDVDLSTVQTTFRGADLIITAKYFR